MNRFSTSLCALLLLLASNVSAGDDDSSLLGDFLQDTLSADSRYIKVTGLEGALSSRATIAKLTVADNAGVWLTIVDAELDWNRLALLRGQFSVNALSAQQIIIARLPGATDTETEIPNAAAQPFALPELPVSIELGKIHVNRIELHKDVAGVPAIVDVTGALKLADGALDTRLAINRLDRDGDAGGLIAKFDNTTRQLTLDLSVNEAAGGVLSSALQIPGAPSVQLSVRGDAPVAAFVADISLATDGVPRLTGAVQVRGVTDAENDDPATTTAFRADLSGDLRALVAPDYQPFFGAATGLHLRARHDPDGRLEIDRFDLQSDGVALSGKLAINGAGEAEHVMVQGQIKPSVGTSVLLPMTGPRTTIQGAEISARYDARVANDWALLMSVDGLSRPDVTLRRTHIRASGIISGATTRQIQGNVSAALTGLDLTDPALHKAVGTDVSLDGGFQMERDGALHLDGFTAQGDDYSATVQGLISGLDSGFDMQGTARVRAADLSRFDGLAGRPVSGGLSAQIKGSGSVLGGTFDIIFDALAHDLTSGIDELDALIPGQTTLTLDAARDETGVTIRQFALTGAALNAKATGTADATTTRLNIKARLDDLGRVIDSFPGPLDLSGSLDRVDDLWSGGLRLDASQGSTASLSGTYHTDGSADFSYDALMTHIERVLPDFAGDLSSTGRATRTDGVWQIKGDAKGPAEINAHISGTLNEADNQADLTANGQLRLGVLNRQITPNSIRGLATFDLALKGTPGLPALSGSIRTSGTSIAVPGIANTLNDLGGSVTLNDGQALIAMTGGLRTGGGVSVKGPVAMQAPFSGNLTISLDHIGLTDNISYETSANGQLVYSGPLAGNGTLSGRIDFGKTEINIAAAGGAANAAPIPDMTHSGEPGDVRHTRDRAGLIKQEKGSNGPVIGLDLALNADKKVFVRGRGLQAELGGNIVIRGTSANVEPVGQIDLIRGNMDILGRRLALTKGLVTLQGKLEPYIDFAASTTTSDGSATLEISGPLGSPEIDVHSDPDRPSEEALAMLIFGNQYSNMSPLQIAQLTASLAQLRGGGGASSGKIRDGLGVDTVDLTQDEDGNAQVGAGAYVSDNIYTDFAVNTNGDTELNINLDVSDNLTAKGTVNSTGSSGLGLFFERDY